MGGCCPNCLRGRTIYKPLLREEATAGKQKGNPENQPLGNQTFSALMDFQGCMEHKSLKILYWDQIEFYWC